MMDHVFNYRLFNACQVTSLAIAESLNHLHARHLLDLHPLDDKPFPDILLGWLLITRPCFHRIRLT